MSDERKLSDECGSLNGPPQSTHLFESLNGTPNEVRGHLGANGNAQVNMQRPAPPPPPPPKKK
jgi:hypothetical protein